MDTGILASTSLACSDHPLPRCFAILSSCREEVTRTNRFQGAIKDVDVFMGNVQRGSLV